MKKSLIAATLLTSLIVQAQNVGIGTNAPGRKLHVKESGSNDSYIRIDNSDPTKQSGVEIQVNGATKTNLYFDPTTGTYGTNGALILNNNGTSSPNLAINPSGTGSVGIGVSLPTNKLDVNGSIRFRETAYSLSGANPSLTIGADISQVLLTTGTSPTGTAALTITSPQTGQHLSIYNSSSIPATLNSTVISAGEAMQFIYSASGWRAVADGSLDDWKTTGNASTAASTNFIGTTDANDFVVKAGGSAVSNERMRFANGTNTIVLGSGEGAAASNGAATTLRGANYTGTNQPGTNLTIQPSNGTGSGGSGAVIINTAPVGSSGSTANTMTEAVRVSSTGFVGINNPSPSQRLHVSHNADGAGVMAIDNATAGGFAGAYFFQNGAANYRGHIGYVNTGGTSGFGGKGTFQLASGNRPLVFSATNGTELFNEVARFDNTTGNFGIGTLPGSLNRLDVYYVGTPSFNATVGNFVGGFSNTTNVFTYGLNSNVTFSGTGNPGYLIAGNFSATGNTEDARALAATCSGSASTYGLLTSSASTGGAAYGVSSTATSNSSSVYGIYGSATYSGSSNPSTTYGGFFTSTGGTQDARGVHATASGSALVYGLYATALGTGSTNIAGFFSANSGSNPYAVYALGNAYFSSSMGIGTTSFTNGKLSVSGFTSYNYGAFAFYARSGTSTNTGYNGGGNNDVSIWASNRVIGSEFNATSDRRIKKDLIKSDAACDLATLMELGVTDFKYVDVVSNGNNYKKGFIAQEVKKVFPEAVHTTTDFVPSIYEMSEKLVVDDDCNLHVFLNKNHELKKGDKVRLFCSDNEEKGYEVADIASEKEFVIANWPKEVESAFVYGKEVHDFHTVDYDRIYTLNVSATQELARKVLQLEKQNRELSTQNSEIRTDVDRLKASVETLLKITGTKAEK
ncbi:MAG: tail fiber domain-containing protein [Chitinophagales bacterium]